MAEDRQRVLIGAAIDRARPIIEELESSAAKRNDALRAKMPIDPTALAVSPKRPQTLRQIQPQHTQA